MEETSNKEHNSTKRTLPKPKADTKKRIAVSRAKRRILKHLWLVRMSIVFSIVLFFGISVFLIARSINKPKMLEFVSVAEAFIFPGVSEPFSYNNRINILVLGKGGRDHTAPDLTDTIVFVSISLQKPSIVTISVPRDIWIPALRAKVNSAFYWGKTKGQESSGLVLAKSTVEEIVGQQINYAVVLDFNSFTKIIDVLGGIQVDVKNAFVDNKYPIAGKEDDLCGGDLEYKCRYETVSFDTGVQIMNGERALKYVRSRNSEGDEGTDIAREKRQEQVISSIKNKLLSKSVFLSPGKILALYKIGTEYTQTDLTPSVTASIVRRVLDSRGEISSHIIPDDMIFSPPRSPRYDNLYVFIPTSGNWNEVNSWVDSLLY